MSVEVFADRTGCTGWKELFRLCPILSSSNDGDAELISSGVARPWRTPDNRAGQTAGRRCARDLPAAGLAEDGARLADTAELKASCLALAGRARHVSGDLAGAEELLVQACAVAPSATQPLVELWLAPFT